MLLYIIGDYLWRNSDTVHKTDNTLWIQYTLLLLIFFFLTKSDQEMGCTMQLDIWLTVNIYLLIYLLIFEQFSKIKEQ